MITSMTTPEGSRVDEALAKLRDAIENRTYLPGEALRLDALSREFEMSVQPVREAIRILEAEGIVERTKNRGAAVRKVSAEEVIELLGLLTVIEPVAVALVTIRASDEELRRARVEHEELQRLVQAGAPSIQVVPRTVDWHRNLYASARSTFLTDFITRSWSAVRLQAAWMASRESHVAVEHEKILQAMESRDARRASELMKQHLREAVTLHLGDLWTTSGPSENYAAFLRLMSDIDPDLDRAVFDATR